MAPAHGRNRSALALAVAAQIRAERAASGLTQRQVMEASGLAKSTYLRMESGERVADVAQLDAFCGAVGVSMSSLLARAEERAVNAPHVDPRAELMGGLSKRNHRIVEGLLSRDDTPDDTPDPS